MNRYFTKRTFIILNILLFLLELLMIFLIIKSILTKDLVRPEEITLYEYIKVKLSNLI